MKLEPRDLAPSPAVRCRGITFTGNNPVLVRDGRKTQTRRVISPQPDWLRPCVGDDGVWHGYCGSGPANGVRCPYGVPGDRLWVRETWATERRFDNHKSLATLPEGGAAVWLASDPERWPNRTGRVRNARFMPRWAARTFLEITDVRVERVIDITEIDAYREGCESTPCARCDESGIEPAGDYAGEACEDCDGRGWHSCRDHFRRLWDQIHGEGAWKMNPWVWAITFKTVEGEPK